MKTLDIGFVVMATGICFAQSPPLPPAPVAAFYVSRKAELEALTAEQLVEAGGWRLDVGQPVYHRISSYNGAPAWLVHFPAFRMSRVQHSGIAIVNDGGAEVAELMERNRIEGPPVNCGFYPASSASVIQIGPNAHMIAVTSEPFRS